MTDLMSPVTGRRAHLNSSPSGERQEFALVPLDAQSDAIRYDLAMSPEMISILSVGVALAALIRAGQARIDKRLENFEKRVDARFQQVDARFQQVDARFREVDARFREVDARLREIDTRLGTLEQRMSRVEGLLEGLGVTGRVGTTVA